MAGESEIEAYLVRRVKETGGYTRKVKWLDRNGGPDRLCWWRGYCLPNAAFVETKAPKKGVNPLSPQGREIALLKETGWPVYVLNTKERVDAFINEMAESVLTT